MITSRSCGTANAVKTLNSSLQREEAKTPESERMVPFGRDKYVATPEKGKSRGRDKESKVRSSPLSSRAQKVKDSLKRKCVVKAVLLKVDGSSEEIEYDTSSKQANQLVGGRPTIIGEFEELNVIIVRSLNQSLGELNRHILPVPFCNKQFNGNYLLYRVDIQGNAVPFTLKQYEKFAADNKTLTENARKNFNPIENQEIKAKSTFCSNSRLTLVFLRSEVDKKIRAEFKQKNGRNPTENEIEESVKASLAKLVEELSSRSCKMDDPDYDPKEDGADVEVLNNLKQIYLEENGVDLANAQLIGTLSNTQRILRSDHEEVLDDRDWRLQLNDALNYVRERGRVDGRILAEKISETFYELNGHEPSLDELVNVFRRIKSKLAEEAKEDDLKEFAFDTADPAEIVDISFRIVCQDLVSRAKSSFTICKRRAPTEDELKASVRNLALKLAETAIQDFADDYDPNNVVDTKLARKDEAEDEEWKKENFNLKMLSTAPVRSRTGISSAHKVYFDKSTAKKEAKNLSKAIESFKMRNRREPNALELNRLKQFLSVDKDTSLIEFELSVVAGRRTRDEREQKSAFSSKKALSTTPSKVLVTPVKKKKTAARYNVYFEDDKEKLDQIRNEKLAIKWFKRFNSREPTKLELAGIKQFTNSDKSELTEMEYEVPVEVDEEDEAKQTELDDEVLKRVKTDSVVQKRASTKYTLNFDDKEERQNGDERQAIRWFKRFNNREPTESEQKKIKQFVKSDRTDVIDLD